MVGRNIRQLRLAADMTQAALAERMGVDRAYVSGLEQGQRNPTLLRLHDVAEALGLNLQLFFKQGRGQPAATGKRRSKN